LQYSLIANATLEQFALNCLCVTLFVTSVTVSDSQSNDVSHTVHDYSSPSGSSST